jgi:hypothetical protein
VAQGDVLVESGASDGDLGLHLVADVPHAGAAPGARGIVGDVGPASWAPERDDRSSRPAPPDGAERRADREG